MRLWILFALISVSGLAKDTDKLWYYNVDDQKLAVNGYDVVAYFTGQAAKGLPQFQTQWQGLTYHFSSKANLEQFLEKPPQYLPQYGGWCAFAMGVDNKKYGFGPVRFACDPESFKVIDDKLYLFTNMPSFNAKEIWDRENQKAMIKRADAYWQTRQELAAQIGELPAGMNRRAPMETAQFAFIVGNWKTETKWMNNIKEKTYAPAIEGHWEAYFDWDGFAITDKWTIPGVPGSGGLAFRSYDLLSQKWVMTYMPSNQPKRNVWVMEGGFDEQGNLTAEFTSEDAQGKAFLQKVYFKNITPNSFSWSADRSYDKGKTWIKDFSTSEQTRIN